MTHTELISRSVLFGNPDRTSVRISPDGENLAYLAPRDGVLNVWVAPVAAPQEARPVTQDTGRGIRVYSWAYTGEHILYLQDAGGDENWRAYCVTLETAEVTDLTPELGVQARLQHLSPRFPHEVLIALNARDERFHDLYRVEIATGKRTLVQENERFAGFLTDEDYAVRFALRMTPDGSIEVLARDGEDWTPFTEIPAEDALTTNPVGLHASGRILYLTDSRERDTAALIAWELESGNRQVLAEDPKVDAEGFWIHPETRAIQAVGLNYERRRWHVVDESIRADLNRLEGVTDGELDVISRSLSDRRWIVAYTVDRGPIRYYLYDRDEGEVRFLFTDRDALEGKPLAAMHPRVLRSGDGLALISYLTLPADSDPDGDGVPGTPLPMVLWVHGGPWGRNVWGYHPFHQWLANRGYAVLSVNYRGSTGFGKGFINAGNHEFAGKMHQDLIDAVDWAVEEGIADPERVAIGGGSYGGYATLVGLTFTPDVFACGVDIVGPSNLVTLLRNVPPYWMPTLPMLTQRVGDPETEEGHALLLERSPLFRVDRICRPLLIGQGANDPRVKQTESDQIVDAMQERGIPVTYVVYPDEGHGFARPQNRLSFMAVAEAFLAEVLGGRAEPFGDDSAGSSMEVRAGAEFVPGLRETLRGRD
jgi:dipeptidyl aminopeptidase/acylaminoacyl peptidase